MLKWLLLLCTYFWHEYSDTNGTLPEDLSFGSWLSVKYQGHSVWSQGNSKLHSIIIPYVLLTCLCLFWMLSQNQICSREKPMAEHPKMIVRIAHSIARRSQVWTALAPTSTWSTSILHGKGPELIGPSSIISLLSPSLTLFTLRAVMNGTANLAWFGKSKIAINGD